MRFGFIVPLVAFFTGCASLSMGCASLPTLTPTASPADRDKTLAACLEVFPPAPWSASHAMDAAMPLGNRASIIGVTRLSAEGLDTVLLSPEGIVLFDASERAGRIRVHRALPPLDRGGFAEGLVEDVRHTFVDPAGRPALVGRSEKSGAPTCRWQSDGRETTDVELSPERTVSIQNYQGASLVRSITLGGVASDGLFPDIVLRVPGAMGYTLHLRLIDHEKPANSTESRDNE